MVIALAGTYNVSNAVRVGEGETLRGAAGARPIIQSDDDIVPVVADGGIGVVATVRHLEIRGRGGLSLLNGVASDMVVTATNDVEAVFMSGPDSSLRDSFALASGNPGGSRAIRVVDTGESGSARLRNVTAIAKGGTSSGIVVLCRVHERDGELRRPNMQTRFWRTSSHVARARISQSSTAGPCGTPAASIAVSYSNYRTTEESGNGTIDRGLGNQTSAALTNHDAIFADDTRYRQRETAPTRNAGVPAPSDAGFVDPDGHPRVGEGQVDIGADEVPAPPSLDTIAPSALGATSADLTGRVDGNGEGVRYRFEYGTTPALGTTTAEQLTESTSLTQVQQAVTGLPPSTTFYYRILGRLNGPQPREAVGDTTSFTTLPASAPAITAQPANRIGATFASLRALLDPMGHATTWRFDWGRTASYGSSSGVADAGSGSTAIPIRVAIDGLRPNTTYHYRAQATSEIATALGSDRTFKTPRLKIKRLRVKPKRSVIKFKLNGDARVKLRFLRKKPGTRRFQRAGKFAFGADPGRHRIGFEALLSEDEELGPGRYKLVARAKHSSGAKSRKVSVAFRLL